MAVADASLDAELLLQRDLLADREPAYARLVEALRVEVAGEFGVRLADCWRDRSFHAVYERPLLLLAALRYDALCDGPAHPLHAAIAARGGDAAAVTAAALTAALAPSRARFYGALRLRFVQTNETSRAVAWLLPAHVLYVAGERRELTLVDLGTSAGLNLIADELPPIWRDEFDQPLVVAPRCGVSARLGFDRSPLDVRQEDTAQWLRACVWPSDDQRLDRLEEGIAALRARAAVGRAPRLEMCGLGDAVGRLQDLPVGPLTLCVQTIVRDYLDAGERAAFEAGMRKFVRERPGAALWAELELDPGGGSMDRAASLTVRFALAGGNLREYLLARTHPHPRRLFVDRRACAELAASFPLATT